MKKNKIIAIIPARGGSQRILNKNIIDFHGKPLILHTLLAARDSNIFDKILVSTDSLLVKNICESAGFPVPFLREENYDNHSSVSHATISALNQANLFFSENYDVVVQLMPNSPLRTSEDILSQFKSFYEDKASFSISCTKFGWQNPWWSFEKKLNNTADFKFSQAINSRSQDLPELYSPNGAIWIAKVKKLMETRTFYNPDTRFYEMDFINSVDIDNPEDLIFAKKMFSLKL